TIGEVPPAVFIPVAERAGLIAGIGSFVLTRACEQFVRHNGAQDRYLTVNVSPLQLLDSGFPLTVSEALARSGLAPDQLVLEITENVLAEESNVVEALHGLRHLGVRVAMDDFGTGYSSLRHLHRFPIDIIKIDRSYIRDIGSDQGAARIVNTLLHMFSALGLTTVAEGVEDADQADLLQRLGCRYGQGYLFSRPVEADLLASALAAPRQADATTPDLLSGVPS
ncbi:MAG TPA: EAL domain-containing protein, partial [Catenuloplanes sp.]